MSRHVHIICPGVPWPVSNSVIADTVQQLKALHDEGIKIHLHYFCSSPNCHPTELNKYCETIYPWLSAATPQADTCVASEEMISILSKDDHPVLFEGLHCNKLLEKLAGTQRRVAVRMYHDECRYHQQLASETGSFIKRMKWKHRSKTMKKLEDRLPANCLYLFSSEENAAASQKDHQLPHIHYLPVFSPYHSVQGQPGMGNFCLYHGNLADPLNEKAAVWLLSSVFNDISTPLVIAGNHPGRTIKKLAAFYSHTCLITDPSVSEMEDLVSKAHIHVLPSFSYKKPEAKLVHAVLCGRHCITNDKGVAGTAFEEACHVAVNAAAFKSVILQLFHQPFEQEEIDLRKRIVRQLNLDNPARQLVHLLFD